ncbi:MAG: bifunctional phosphoribosylaminoimidazolecarboxamide formyltransferase/IMP cyclohydrolase PurH [Calditrichaeota bacterium]|nr:MAG: bifunctional phosphoribosylaminoimidazolecarboxamide formyltransferase/IMP cyclohydrolase PurH [Calditrichota bacterium]
MKRRALISVSDKTGVETLARALIRHDYEIISSGGTFRYLSEHAIPVIPVEDVTRFPEMLDGRVKTLHPRIHGALLARREESHLKQLKEQNITPIDVVVVNLYPFEQAVSRSDISEAEAVEEIDIGGPTLLRAAAKNFRWVTALHSPRQYTAFIEQLDTNNGTTDGAFRQHCAVGVFRALARYNAAIARFFDPEAETLPETFVLSGIKQQTLRYGENPHQQAAWYRHADAGAHGALKQWHGKELSFNNLLDIQSALNTVNTFPADTPACVIVKHNNPCGVGTGATAKEAQERARSTDPVSSFGGIIAVNQPVDMELAESIAPYFTECIVAPAFHQDARERLQKKKNLRLLSYDPRHFTPPRWDVKSLSGGFLVQNSDIIEEDIRQARVVTQRPPTEEEWRALDFAWKVVRHVKSNAIIFTNQVQTLGIGAGQMSRVDATEIAVKKAHNAGLNLKGSAVASDAFFPFRDGVEALIEAGATAVIQPGGSIRDEEVIEAADKAGITMVFTGIRHFKH